MPELPEVETCRAGISAHITGKTFKSVIIRQPQLRWPVPEHLATTLPGLELIDIARRGKYLLLNTIQGSLLLHLGMSGRLHITTATQAAAKHDHVDFVFTDGTVLRFNDQRKFGAVLWSAEPANEHPLLSSLGPEPLSTEFNGQYLLARAGNRTIAIKSLLMDSHIVVGVGNIYANESLFMAGILPDRSAGSISQAEFERLSAAVKAVLERAIAQGGTTLRDFINPEGKPGYFQQSLNVYGRSGQPCLSCGYPIESIKIAQRSSFFCATCQV